MRIDDAQRANGLAFGMEWHTRISDDAAADGLIVSNQVVFPGVVHDELLTRRNHIFAKGDVEADLALEGIHALGPVADRAFDVVPIAANQGNESAGRPEHLRREAGNLVEGLFRTAIK